MYVKDRQTPAFIGVKCQGCTHAYNYRLPTWAYILDLGAHPECSLHTQYTVVFLVVFFSLFLSFFPSSV